ncbi:MAG: GntR family transcriptional regulator [Burkholderiaceae bacterium]|nr:GntR family transcriptional regulator [Burkholderiaceae bacterium]
MAGIRDAIVDGRYRFGEQLSEASLATVMGISKTPVREALLRLQSEGLVQVHPQRGSFVFALDETGVRNVCRFREIIECAALAEAMQADAATLQKRLERNVAQMARAHGASDLAALPRLDQAFHEAIVDACRNPYLQRSYALVAYKIRALRSRLPEENERVAHCQANHERIVDAVRSADVKRSQTLLAEHIRDTLQSYLAASRQEGSGG